MIRYLFIATFSLFFALGLQPAEARQNVVDYYAELQQIAHLDLEYSLEKRGKKWVTQNLSWDEKIPVIVDLKAGYIFFSDGGTGGGNFETQIVLWRKSDGSPLIGIAEVGFDPPYPGNSRVRFFEKENKRWRDVTSYVMPRIAISDYLSATMTMRDLRAMHAINSSIYVSLPRRGTAISAYLVVKETYTNAVCNGEDWFNPGDTAPYLRYCDHMEGRIDTLIRLTWNKEESRFVTGKKTRAKSLPWSEAD